MVHTDVMERRSKSYKRRRPHPNRVICRHGHKKVGDNLYVTTDGHHRCVQCQKDSQQKFFRVHGERQNTRKMFWKREPKNEVEKWRIILHNEGLGEHVGSSGLTYIPEYHENEMMPASHNLY